jgi:polysaccharide export outer membrane protein
LQGYEGSIRQIIRKLITIKFNKANGFLIFCNLILALQKNILPIMIKQLVFFVTLALLASSCKFLNPSQMLRAPKDYPYEPLPKAKELETRLNPNDQISMVLLTNDGFKLLDLVGEQQIGVNQLGTNLTYRIEFDGLINLPILGRVKLGGLTVREAEMFLEEEFSKYYIQPFVILRITNRKVLVFSGTDGNAKVVPLVDENTNLIRVLAQAGGVTKTGRAYDIKVIRGEFSEPKVYHFNLRHIDGLKESDFMMQSNDIIYVTPSPQVARTLLIEIGPYLSLLTTLLLVLNYFK